MPDNAHAAWLAVLKDATFGEQHIPNSKIKEILSPAR